MELVKELPEIFRRICRAETEIFLVMKEVKDKEFRL